MRCLSLAGLRGLLDRQLAVEDLRPACCGGCCRSRRRPSASRSGRTSYERPARSLTLLPRRLVAFGMLPFACSAFSEAVVGEVLDPVRRKRLVAARRRDGQVGTTEEAGDRLTPHVAGHHELRGRSGVLLADAAAEPARADDRRGPGPVRRRRTGFGCVSSVVLLGPRGRV